VLSLLNERWGELDPDAPAMLDALRAQPGFIQFPHAREVFKDHLLGTFSVLAAWGQPREVARAGFFHTGYSGDLFQFFVWDAANPGDRKELADIVGKEAERLIWLFGTVRRGSILNLTGLISGELEGPADPLRGGLSETVRVPHRLSNFTEISISNADAAKIMTVTLADYLDQMVEVNGWRDHHQVETPGRLYPGNSGPAVALYWISALCNGIRGHLDKIPPMFDSCRATISKGGETKARDAYWSVVSGESGLSDEEQISRLKEAIEYNPWVAEPHVLLSQLYFRSEQYELAAKHSQDALRKFYAFATAWDKRLKFNSWVAFARLMLLRSRRKALGHASSMPIRDDLPATSAGLPLVSIPDLVELM